MRIVYQNMPDVSSYRTLPHRTRLGALITRLRRKANPHVPTIKHSKLRLEEDVTVNGKGQSLVVLNPTKAQRPGREGIALQRRELDNVTGNDSAIPVDDGGEGRQVLATVKHDAARLRVVLRRWHRGVVGLHSLRRDQHQRGACVRDGLVRQLYRRAIADGDAGRAELPEALRGVDGDEVDGAGELGLVDEAEVVVAS